MKQRRIESEEALDKFRGSPCLICGKPSDPCHIKTKGAGGPDEEWNLLALCRTHHSIQHQYGFARFSIMFPIIAHELRVKGWSFDHRGKLSRVP